MLGLDVQIFTVVMGCVFYLNVLVAASLHNDREIHKSHSFRILDHFILSLYCVQAHLCTDLYNQTFIY